jgi:hypothetical protein
LPSLGRRNGVGAPFPNPAAKQGEPQAAVGAAPLFEQFRFNAVGARETPGGDRDAPREHGLEHADRRQLRDHGRLERGELGGVLVRQHEMLLCAQGRASGHSAPTWPCLRPSSDRATSRRSCGSLRRAHG